MLLKKLLTGWPCIWRRCDVICRKCEKDRKNAGKGLCPTCYSRYWYHLNAKKNAEKKRDYVSNKKPVGQPSQDLRRITDRPKKPEDIKDLPDMSDWAKNPQAMCHLSAEKFVREFNKLILKVRKIFLW